MKLSAIFWDVDGVFVDTERLHFKAWQVVFGELGASLTLDDYAVCVGRGGEENMKYLLSLKGISPERYPTLPSEEALNNHRKEIYKELRATEGIQVIKENVAFAKQAHRELGESVRHLAVSSSKRPIVLENLERAGLVSIFDHIISFEDEPGLQRKPHPDLYNFALKKAGVSSDRVIAFEDSESGVMSASTAGILTIAVPNEFTQSQDFSKARIVIHPGAKKDITEILEKLSV